MTPLRSARSITTCARYVRRAVAATATTQHAAHAQPHARSIHHASTPAGPFQGISGLLSGCQDEQTRRQQVQEDTEHQCERLVYLAQEKQYVEMLRVVSDVYEPLYRTHPALLAVKSPLAALVPEKPAYLQQRVHRFDDGMAKLVEQYAMGHFLGAKQWDLVAAVYEHRLFAVRRMQRSGIFDENCLRHHKKFFFRAIVSYGQLQQYKKVLQVYRDALEADRVPSALMSANYAKSLARLRRFDDMRAFYDEVLEAERPTNGDFHRHMLVAANALYDVAFLQRVLERIKLDDVELSEKDYVNAMATFDRLYFFSQRLHPQGLWSVPLDTYSDCVAEWDDRQADPQEYSEMEAACQVVLFLFDEMVHMKKLVPHDDQLYPRVITAAVKLQDFDKMRECLALWQENSNGRPLHYAAMRMAVNGFLLMDKPDEAWQLVKQRYQPKDAGNVLIYCCHRNRADLVLQILNEVTSNHEWDFAFTPKTVQFVFKALCRHSRGLADDDLWQLIETHQHVFAPVLQHPSTFVQAVYSSLAGRRDKTLKNVLTHRDRQRLQWLNVSQGLLVVRRFHAKNDHAFVCQLFADIDLKMTEDKQVVATLCKYVLESMAVLGRIEDIPDVHEIYQHYCGAEPLPARIQSIVDAARAPESVLLAPAQSTREVTEPQPRDLLMPSALL